MSNPHPKNNLTLEGCRKGWKGWLRQRKLKALAKKKAKKRGRE